MSWRTARPSAPFAWNELHVVQLPLLGCLGLSGMTARSCLRSPLALSTIVKTLCAIACQHC